MLKKSEIAKKRRQREKRFVWGYRPDKLVKLLVRFDCGIYSGVEMLNGEARLSIPLPQAFIGVPVLDLFMLGHAVVIRCYLKGRRVALHSCVGAELVRGA